MSRTDPGGGDAKRDDCMNRLFHSDRCICNGKEPNCPGSRNSFPLYRAINTLELSIKGPTSRLQMGPIWPTIKAFITLSANSFVFIFIHSAVNRASLTSNGPLLNRLCKVTVLGLKEPLND